MTFRWQTTAFVVCLAQRAAALVATPHVEHLVVHDAAGRRTAVAEVADRGEVSLHFRQEQSAQDTVYGSVMLLVDEPSSFAVNSAAQSAAQKAIMDLAAAGRSVKHVGASSALLAESSAVRVDFQAAFHKDDDKQAFIADALKDAGGKLVGNICGQVPSAYKSRCQSPGLNLLDISDEAAAEFGNCDGTFLFKPNVSLREFFHEPSRQEALSMAISEVAWVSRLQVGTMMAMETADAVRVHFFLTSSPQYCQAAIQRVEDGSELVGSLARERVAESFSNRQGSERFFAYGRIGLQVPSAQLFASDNTTRRSVRSVIARLAATPRSAHQSRIPVTNVSASVAAVANATDAVRVGFRVGFTSRKDRQAFTWTFVRDGGNKLAGGINRTLPGVCAGKCRLPGQQATAVRRLSMYGYPYGTFRLWVSQARSFASSSMVQQGMVKAISELAAVDQQQVGLLLADEHATRVSASFWVTSGNATLRQAAIQRVGKAPRHKFAFCTLAALDRAHRLASAAGSGAAPTKARQPSGKMLVYVFSANSFVNDEAAQEAMKRTIAEVAAVPPSQVGISMTAESPVLASINFRVVSTNATLGQAAVQRVNTAWTAQNLTRAMDRMKTSFTSPAFMVTGGTVGSAGAGIRYKC